MRVFCSPVLFRRSLPDKLAFFSRRCLSTLSQDRARSGPFPSRTHNCGNISAYNAGERVVLAGWLLPGRKMKDLFFYPLKDSHGTTQLVIKRDEHSDIVDTLKDIPVESVVLVQGSVVARPLRAIRPGPAGDIDIEIDHLTILNSADPNLPFIPSSTHALPNEEFRLRHRYLDLRRSALTSNIKTRSQVVHIIRDLMYSQGFMEVETPILLRSSPEGAREFLVPTKKPSDASSPLFYALPQSPQQPKQLLICSGVVDKYYQIAKCFRDEAGRKDRQPEFTQVDLEMAFVSWGSNTPSTRSADPHMNSWRIGGTEVRDVIESLVSKIWRAIEGIELPATFPVMTYDAAMAKYGSDKPDTRFGLEIHDLSSILSPEPVCEDDEILECIPVRQSSEPAFLAISTTLSSELESSVERITLTEDNLTSWSIENKIVGATSQVHNLNDNLHLSAGDVIWICRRSRIPSGGSTALGQLRLRLLEEAMAIGAYELTAAPHFLWVTEFPLFTRADEDKEFLAHGRWSSSHHPFTAPMWEDVPLLMSGKAEAVRGQHYDLVLNGTEIGGGSVRVHDAAMQEFIFAKILQLTQSEMEPFSQLLGALKSGAPPHGGIALGFDRLMSILCKTTSIRDVIAFPKTSAGTDILLKSPAPVDDITLSRYGLVSSKVQ